MSHTLTLAATLSETDVAAFAERLDAAERDATAVAQLTDDVPDLSPEDGYRIQDALVARKRDRGQAVVGFKLAFTSRAKQRAMGIDTVGFGYLFDYMEVPDGGQVDLARLVHPRAEAEVAFLMADAVDRPVSARQILDATRAVAPAVDLIDSRYRDFRFTLADVVADNVSAARFVVGTDAVAPHALDLRLAGVVAEQNGRVVATGAAGAALGHPATAVAELATFLARRGETLLAGSVVLAGGLTAPWPLAPGDHVSVSVHRAGRAHFSAL